jgi:pyridoxal phosphate enzyme (YggS family)
MQPSIAENLENVRGTIFEAEKTSKRQPGTVELVAISKTHSPEVIQEAIEAGQLVFGENRVQEAKAKLSALPSKLRWHLVGHLQSNKVRVALTLFEVIHGIDSVELLRTMESSAEQLGLFPKALLQVNVAGEASKFGFSPERLISQLDAILQIKRVEILGLMTIPPLARQAEDSRKYFVRLREIRDQIEKEHQIHLPHLSMGMSGDYAVAVEEGATMVRVGTAIFGQRRSK